MHCFCNQVRVGTIVTVVMLADIVVLALLTQRWPSYFTYRTLLIIIVITLVGTM